MVTFFFMVMAPLWRIRLAAAAANETAVSGFHAGFDGDVLHVRSSSFCVGG